MLAGHSTPPGKEHLKAVVLEAPEAVPTALHLLQAVVHALGDVAGAGAVVVEDSGPPPLERPAESTELGNRILPAAHDRLGRGGGGALQRA